MKCPVSFGDQKERFEIIDNIEGIRSDLYEISNYGRMINVNTGKYKIPTKDRKGYYYFTVVTNIPNKQKHLYIHRTVASKFIDKGRDDQNIVNHIDGNPTNNMYYNLEYCTLSENSIHSVNMGLSPTGEDHKNSVYSNELAHIVCQYLEQGYSCNEIVDLMDLSVDINIENFKKFIRDIRAKRSRKQISKLYNF